mmetsp:Transcript_13703/g.13630  ORF Transcript_13703/g.13630 Transcript_13703/m.13630 type:complete len:315 (+) Transcript_13703:188-1132(+)
MKKREAKFEHKKEFNEPQSSSSSHENNYSEKEKKDKIKKQNKIRSQRSRQRRKKYTEELEQKIQKLEKQVSELTIQNDTYQKMLLNKGISGDSEKNVIDEKLIPPYIVDILSELDQSKNTEKFSKYYLDMVKEKGIVGEKRMKIFKRAFDVLIDFMLPDPFRYALYMTDINDSPDSEWLNAKLIRKMKKMAPCHIMEQVETGAISPANLNFYGLDATDEQIDRLNGLYHLLVNGKREYLDIIKRMNQLRLDIEKSGEVIGKWPIEVVPILAPEQLKKGYSNVGIAKSEKKLSIENLFKIPLKEQFREAEDDENV